MTSYFALHSAHIFCYVSQHQFFPLWTECISYKLVMRLITNYSYEIIETAQVSCLSFHFWPKFWMYAKTEVSQNLVIEQTINIYISSKHVVCCRTVLCCEELGWGSRWESLCKCKVLVYLLLWLSLLWCTAICLTPSPHCL